MASPNRSQTSNSKKTYLIVVRSSKPNCTIGKLYIIGQYSNWTVKYLCDTLENPDWGLFDGNTDEEIWHMKGRWDANNNKICWIEKGKKVCTGLHEKNCAIQRGVFKMKWEYSNKFGGNNAKTEYKNFYKKFNYHTPLIEIKCWSGVRIHYGLNTGWTEGCILCGKNITGNSITKENSQDTVNQRYPIIRDACASGEVYIIMCMKNDRIYNVMKKNYPSLP